MAGENVLHMAIVNEDPVMTKFLLDHGASYNQRCSGSFMGPEDQKASRNDTLESEVVTVNKVTDYDGYRHLLSIFSLSSLYLPSISSQPNWICDNIYRTLDNWYRYVSDMIWCQSDRGYFMWFLMILMIDDCLVMGLVTCIGASTRCPSRLASVRRNVTGSSWPKVLILIYRIPTAIWSCTCWSSTIRW